MPVQLTDPAIAELSVVFGAYKGKEFEPRNAEARVLSIKGGEKSLVAKAVEALKAYFASNNDLVTVQPYPVTSAEDNIDHDGDGPEDYNQIVFALCGVYNDISQAWCIQDDAARSAAIVNAIDSFLAGLDALRSSDTEKAGARHSKTDAAHISAIKDAHAKMAEHLDALQAAEDADKAKAKDGKYGDVAYADEKNKKYPIDTEEHARAAWSYINQEKNASDYSADELATIKDRIRAACKKFGIEISDDGKKAGEVDDMTPDEVNALIAQALAAKDAEKAQEIDAAKAQAKAEAHAAAQVQIDAAKAAEAQAKAGEAAAKAEAEKSAEREAAANEVLKAAAGLAKAPTATSSATQKAGPSRLEQVLKAQMVLNPGSHVF